MPDSGTIQDHTIPQEGPGGYPLVLTNLSRVKTVVIGGGRVAERKVKFLLAAGAHITVVSPQCTPLLQSWAEEGLIQIENRPYRTGDLEDAWLAIIATNRKEVNDLAGAEAGMKRILCNRADAPGEGNFITPAVYRGKIALVAVSDTGRSPRLAQRIRDRLANWLEGENFDER